MSDTEVLDQEEVEAEAEAEASNGKAKRASTTYFDPSAVEALDDLPKQERTNTGRSKIYFNLLEKIAEQGVDNKWRPLAQFGTGTGARTVATSLNKQVDGNIGDGKGQVKVENVRMIPEYEGHKWVFDARRVPGENDQVNSILYAKLVAS